jgi:TonB family protein
MNQGSESDLGELAALFTAHSGGTFSAEVSADLALEIVLNEIVEEACLTTGATGAAIILKRDGEMVCRASSGANAPQFGARLDSESGLTAECIRTRQAQRCDDAQTDPRADMEASRILGIRSVMILPLLCGSELAGVLEVFSARPGAFGDRDEQALQALGQRILNNLERAGEALVASSGAAEQSIPAVSDEAADTSSKLDLQVAVNELENSQAGLASNVNEEVEAAGKSAGHSPRARFDVVTFSLTAAVVVCAMLLATLVGLRMSSRKAAVRGKTAAPIVSAAKPENNAAPASPGADSATAPGVDVDKEKKDPVKSGSVRLKESSPPAGSLLVYENGKEVFRMTPAGEPSAATATEQNSSGVEKASAVESNGTVEVSAEAEGNVLHRVEPGYPEAARQQRVQGAVVLDVRIGRDGTVQSVQMVSGESVLADAAIAAVKQWKFKPALRLGQPVEMQTRVTLNFRLPG